MRHLLVPICAVAALAAACDGDRSVRISSTRTDTEAKGVLKVVDTLQCPETQGVLTRKGSAQSDGRVCVYSGPKGAEVSLHLVKLEAGSSAETVLAAFEQQLKSALPHTVADLNARVADAQANAADARAAQADTDARSADTAAAQADARTAATDQAHVRLPGLQVDARGEDARVRMPGLSVNAQGDRADVRIGGFTIRADDSDGQVAIQTADESVSVQAHDDAAEIRTRAPGEAVRTTYILTDNRASSDGWRLVGYEARGPAGGPVVIATVRSKDKNNDRVFDAAKALVGLNVGE